MAQSVKILIAVEFEADSEAAVNAALMRIPNDLKTSLEHGRLPGVPTGVKNAKVEIVKKS